MKTIKLISLIFTGALLLTSCRKNEISPEQARSQIRIPVELSAVSTRVSFIQGEDDGARIYTPVWQDGDSLAVFTTGAATNANEPFAVANITAEGVAGSFTGSLNVNPEGGEYTLYAIHPYPGVNPSNTDYSACLSGIPSIQHPTTSSPDTKSYIAVAFPMEGNIPAAAQSLVVNGLMLKRVTSPIVFAISADDGATDKVSEVSLKAGSAVVLSGKCRINLHNGDINSFTEPSNMVSAVYSGEGAPSVNQFEAWFMVNPQTLAEGTTLELSVKAGDNTYVKEIIVPQGGIKLENNVVSRINVTVNKRISETWEDATSEFSLPEGMTVYKSTTLHNRAGNKGFVIKIPAGKINMKSSYSVQAVETHFQPTKSFSDVVMENPGYHLFVSGISVMYFKPIMRTLSINNGLVDVVDDNANNTGLGKAYPWYHWNLKRFTCPPTLGVKDGVASISYADVLTNSGQDVLHKFDTPQYGETKDGFTGGTPWDADCAISGYAYPLKNGEMRLSGDNEAAYLALARQERIYTFSTVNNQQVIVNASIMYNGQVTSNLDTYKADGLRMARTLIAVNANGDLFIFVSERFVNHNNVLFDADDPSDGSTLYEATLTLKDKFGCTDAMSLHFERYSVVSIQDGNKGSDLTRTCCRRNDEEEAKAKYSNVIMFKGETPVPPVGYGAFNAAGATISENDYSF